MLPAVWPPPDPERSAAERLEALLELEIASEEETRASLGTLPRLAGEAAQCARRLAMLTQTLKTLRAIPAPAPPAMPDDPDMPEDIDEFRRNLARKINAFVESRLGAERMALDKQFGALSDDEMKELADVGRERGMRAFLAAPEEPDAMEEEVMGGADSPARSSVAGEDTE